MILGKPITLYMAPAHLNIVVVIHRNCAARLVAQATVRSGSELVTVVSPSDAQDIPMIIYDVANVYGQNYVVL